MSQLDSVPRPLPSEPALERSSSLEKMEVEKSEVKGRTVNDTTVLPSYQKNGVEVGDAHGSSASHDGLDEDEPRGRRPAWLKHVILAGLGLLILAWWISGIVLKDTRHRWIQSTIFAWFFIFLIISQYVPNSVVTKPVGAAWETCLSKPFFALPYLARIGLGVAALVGLVIGPAFGFTPGVGTNYGQRCIGILCLIVLQAGFFLTSESKKSIQWDTVIVGLCLQQVIALFVLKTSAGFDLFKWIATLATDFLSQAYKGSAFFFDAEVVYDKFWFVATVLFVVIFFIAFVQMMTYYGILQWIIGKFSWVFFKLLRVSGAEATIVTATPFIGQGESACLAKSFFPHMTASEIHQTMTSGFATVSGSTFLAYVSFGVPAQNIITSAVMSIPASIAISKLRYPEREEPLTRGRMIIPKDDENERSHSGLEAFSNGAAFGLKVAGLILCNVAVILALVGTIDGLLTWIGKSFGIHQLTLELVIGYILYPVAWLMGAPKQDLLTIGRLLATKSISNEFVAYQSLQKLRTAGQISPRGDLIVGYALCGFANLSSLGIQIGVLSALAPGKKRTVVRVAWSALICGFFSTIQTAAIAGILL